MFAVSGARKGFLIVEYYAVKNIYILYLKLYTVVTRLKYYLVL